MLRLLQHKHKKETKKKKNKISQYYGHETITDTQKKKKYKKKSNEIGIETHLPTEKSFILTYSVSRKL